MKDYNTLLWVFFVSQGLTDHTDLMRASMFCMECCKEGASVESVKDSSGYKSCLSDLPDSMLTDEKIQEMIDWKPYYI